MKVLRESVPKQVDESGVPEEKKGVWGSQGGNRGLEFSRGRKGHFFPTYLSKDYITMYPAWVQFCLLEHLLSNPIMLKCILWVWVWVVQLLSHVWLFASPWTAEHQVSLSITKSRSVHKLMSSESVTPSNHVILCHPLLLLPSILLNIRVFSNVSALCIRWPKYWSFSFNISPSNEHPGLISFRIDWLELLAVQGNLKSLLQHHSSKASILWCSAFLIVQLSHPYMSTGKTIALTRWALFGKVMSLLFNMLSRLVITFLPRSKHLLISWLQSPSAVILEPENKIFHFPLFPHLFAMKW